MVCFLLWIYNIWVKRTFLFVTYVLRRWIGLSCTRPIFLLRKHVRSLQAKVFVPQPTCTTNRAALWYIRLVYPVCREKRQINKTPKRASRNIRAVGDVPTAAPTISLDAGLGKRGSECKSKLLLRYGAVLCLIILIRLHIFVIIENF